MTTDNDAAQPDEQATRPRRTLPPALARKTWQPGQSGNPKGRRPNGPNLLKKMSVLLERESDMYEAVRVIDAAWGKDAEAAAELWSVEQLTNGDLVVQAMLGIALNRVGRVPYAVQLQAQAYIIDRMHGKLTDKTPGFLDETDESQRPLMTVEEFRAAISMAPPEASATVTDLPTTVDEVIGIEPTPEEGAS